MGKNDPEVRANQRYWFRRQLNLAREKVLPVSIHSRDAAKDTLDIAKEEHLAEIGGVVHCFLLIQWKWAREYLNMGMYLGIGGVLTYKNARVLKEVVDYAPMDRIVLETDSPVSDTCAEPRQAEFFTESAVCGDGHCGDQGYYDSRG